MHFYCEKNYSWPETGTGGFNRPPTAEDVQCMGVENIARGAQLSQPHVNSQPDSKKKETSKSFTTSNNNTEMFTSLNASSHSPPDTNVTMASSQS